jgi:hypothetical protein
MALAQQRDKRNYLVHLLYVRQVSGMVLTHVLLAVCDPGRAVPRAEEGFGSVSRDAPALCRSMTSA